ncbi:hypothetical protein ACJMK2_041189, partial [Sinanodonta woodiana]
TGNADIENVDKFLSSISMVTEETGNADIENVDKLFYSISMVTVETGNADIENVEELLCSISMVTVRIGKADVENVDESHYQEYAMKIPEQLNRQIQIQASLFCVNESRLQFAVKRK